jgi:hypothetical protein
MSLPFASLMTLVFFLKHWFGGEKGICAMTSGRLEVFANFVEPCSYCGAACTGTILFSYRDGRRRLGFETDRGSLSEPLRELVGTAIDRGDYGILPAFAREWNEARGWADFASDGAAVDIDELLWTVDALDRLRPAADVRGGEMLARLRAFVLEAARDGREMWVEET